jgi:aldose sugar dehydrogenase
MRIYITLLFFIFLSACSKDDANGTTPPAPGVYELQLNELLSGLSNPWGLCFPSDNEILFTERNGNIWLYNLDNGSKTAVTGGPTIVQAGQGGLLDVVLHPDFEQNGYVYFSYASGSSGAANTAVGRGVLQGNTLQNFTQIFQATPLTGSGVHFGSRMVFDDAGYLYVSVGDRGEQQWAQDSSNHAGKLHRLHDDGSVPSDNPFVQVTGAMPEIYTMGNRNIQGMDIHPVNRKIYTHEHGPQGGDELNLMQAGLNYGWPLVTHGVNYNGTPITPHTSLPGYEDPLYHWTPSVAPCGMAFVPESFNMPKGETIIIGTLATQHLKGIVFQNDKVISTHRYFEGEARFRAIAFHGNRCFVLSESPGKLYELVSVEL